MRVFLAVGCLLFAFLFASSGIDTLQGDPEPEAPPVPFSCRELIEKGPGNARQIRLTDFSAWDDFYVFEGRFGRENGLEDGSTPVWVPVFPLDHPAFEDPDNQEPPASIDLVLHFRSLADEDELYEQLLEDTLDGSWRQSRFAIDRETRELLEEHFGRPVAKEIAVLTIGPEPDPEILAVAMFTISAFSLVGAWLLFRSSNRHRRKRAAPEDDFEDDLDDLHDTSAPPPLPR